MADLRVPPHNLEAEQSVLGAIFIDSETIYKVAEKLHAEHFYDRNNQELFTAIIQLYTARKPIDVLTVSDILKRNSKLSQIGGTAYLSQLVASVPTAAHIEEYAQIIIDTATRRKMISLSAKLGELAHQQNKDIETLMDEAETQLLSVSQASTRKGFVHVAELLEQSFERAELLHNNPDMLRGVSSGFPYLDQHLGGLQRSDLIILAARPSVGKSAFTLDVARYAAIHDKRSVAFFSLEMAAAQLMDRLMSMQTGISAWDIRMSKIKDSEYHKLSDAMGVFSEAKLYIDDTPGLSIMEIRNRSRKLKLEHGLDLIIIDYLQLIVGRQQESRVNEVSEISRLLKGLARELDVPVVALSQLSRNVEQRGSSIPQLSDLRDSGAIEQDADIVIFLSKIEDEDNIDAKGGEDRLLTIAKHRNGPTGQVALRFIKELARFRELDREH